MAQVYAVHFVNVTVGNKLAGKITLQGQAPLAPDEKQTLLDDNVFWVDLEVNHRMLPASNTEVVGGSVNFRPHQGTGDKSWMEGVDGNGKKVQILWAVHVPDEE